MLLATWEAAYRLVQWKPWVFPAPSHVLDATLSMVNVRSAFGDPVGPGWPWPKGAAPARAAQPWYRGELVEALGISAVRLVVGFAISIVLGTLLGLLMWRFRPFDDFIGPVCLGLQTLPSVCWVPLAVIRFGLNEKGILFVIVMGSVFAVAIALRDGLKTIPPLYQRAFAWRSLLGAELILVVSRHGIGFLLEMGRNFSDSAQIVAVMIIMVMVGMAVDRWVFAKLQRRVHARFGLA